MCVAQDYLGLATLYQVIIFETLLASLLCISLHLINFILDFVAYKVALMTFDLSTSNYPILCNIQCRSNLENLLSYKVS